MIFKDYIRTARPHHYLKNLFVFGPIIFARYFYELDKVAAALLTFVAFSFAASAIYFLNDTFDRNADRIHAEKRHRPIAAGRISVPQAVLTSILLSVLACVVSFVFINTTTGYIVAFYLLINLFYSWKFKHVVIIDVFIIAFGFVLRLSAGGTAIGAEISEWILLCVISLSLFLGLAKRREEYLNADFSAVDNTRQVLAQYDKQFLDQMIAIIASLTIVSYSLYTILNTQYSHLLYTIPIVMYGIFRYLFIIYKKQGGAKPEHEMLNDRHILASVLLWALQVIIILVFFQ